MTETHPEITLADVHWLTALARSLVHDGAEAEDLVQETWIAATKSPPASGGVNRAWLARVLKNFHLKSLRSSRRRSRREEHASKPEATPSTAELRRTLAECLLALDEPYRRTLMLVTFENYSTAEIAERDGVSVGVVRHRLRKARELYRQQLERDHGGDWSKWYAVLLPFASLPLPGGVAGSLGVRAAARPALALGGSLIVIKALAAAVVLAAALLVWELLDPSSSSRRSAPSDGRVETHQVGAPREDAGPESARRAPVARPSDATVRISGRVAVQVEPGVVEEDADGWILVAVGGRPQQVTVEGGRFQFDAEAKDTIAVDEHAVFAGRGARIDTQGDLGPFQRDAEIVVEARWPPPVEILVLDRDTRQPLDGLTIVRASAIRIAAYRDPEVVVRSGRSPIQLSPVGFSTGRYAVRRDGYGWHSFTVDPEAGGQRQVLLGRGDATIVVHVKGEILDGIVTVESERTSWCERAKIEGGRARFEHVPPGEYRVSASSRGGGGAHVEVALVDGFNEVHLEVAAPKVRPKVDVAGVIFLPSEWGLDSFELKLGPGPRGSVPSDEMERGPYKGMWRFSAEGLRSGSLYEFSIPEAGWGHWVRVDGSELRFDLPPPGLAAFELVDTQSGERLTDQTPGLEVRASWRANRFGVGVPSPTYDRVSGLWRLRAPLGQVRLGIRSPDYSTSASLTVGLRPLQHRIEVLKSASLIVEYFDGETRVPCPLGAFPSLEHVDGETAGRGSLRNGEHVWQVERPGVYRVAFPLLDGFELVTPVELELENGKLHRHRVQLVRKQ